MGDTVKQLHEFVNYVKSYMKGDEKGEAQTFLERLFMAFGHAGHKQAGAVMEERIRTGRKSTSFADLVWHKRVLIEMKKRGEHLPSHFLQARDYWIAMKDKPRYVVLCNFDEFLVYDAFHMLDEPADQVLLEDLPQRFRALNFLFETDRPPQFGVDRVKVSRAAADSVSSVFNSLIKRRVDRKLAQRFILQCVTALFAEDIDLLPHGLFTGVLLDCKERRAHAYNELESLFRQMDNPVQAQGGRYVGVPYFNGGLFSMVQPVDLRQPELDDLYNAAIENWSYVRPAIFGSLFEGSMDHEERHALGAHYTSELDILKVVLPTVVEPWRKRIDAANTAAQLTALYTGLLTFKVLDPACGSGNFLYVAYREMKRLELAIVTRLYQEFGIKAPVIETTESHVTARQFYGIDLKPFAVELARLTLMLGRKLALDEYADYLERNDIRPTFALEEPLPLDTLDANIRCDDALFCEWPTVDAIIGNPPYQSKNKMQQELGVDYVQKLRARYTEVPGRADYCVYWFRRAHDEIKTGGRVGLVGTNTIRQNYSREGGLDYVVANGGTITDAVSTQVWSGDAAVHVSIVNWIKGSAGGPKKLRFQVGDGPESPFDEHEVEAINSSLSKVVDVAGAQSLACNTAVKTCFQGQTHGHEGFLVDAVQAQEILKKEPKSAEILFPFLIGDELIGARGSQATRYVIDFHPRDVIDSSAYKILFERVEKTVLPTRTEAARAEEERNAEALEVNPKAKVNHHHRNFLNHWWHLSYPRSDLIKVLSALPRYIACARVTKRPIFEVIDSRVRPNDMVVVFTFPDDYSFGLLQSGLHWAWFTARCSTLTERFRYTSDTVYYSFPWPQKPAEKAILAVADAAVALRGLRSEIMDKRGWSLRDLYRMLEKPGENPLRTAQATLDDAVRAAYGMGKDDDPLAFLLALNQRLASGEIPAEQATPPGLPAYVTNREAYVTTDCVRMMAAGKKGALL
jgi:SAM-dependent methyltransferase